MKAVVVVVEEARNTKSKKLHPFQFAVAAAALGGPYLLALLPQRENSIS